MELINFLLKLAMRFTPLEPYETESLQREAVDWWKSIPTLSPLATEQQKKEFEEKLEKDKKMKASVVVKKVFSFWGIKLVLAFVFLFAIKWFQSYMNEENEPTKTDH